MCLTDIWWSILDIGWIVGYSYMVYVLLLIGCIIVVFEGVFDFLKSESTWWAVVEEMCVIGIFIFLIVIRVLMCYGDELLGSVDYFGVERIFFVGEVFNLLVWYWLQNIIF